MIKILLFDADGVLLFHTDKLFSERLSKHLDISVETIKPFFETVFYECLTGIKDLKSEIEPYAINWGWQGSVDELLTFWFEYEHNVDQPLIDYVVAARRQDIYSYIVTNNEKYRAEAMFSNFNLDHTVFKDIFSAGRLGVLKPETSYYQKVFESIGDIQKDEVLFWDDRQENVDAAKNFGFEAELYTDYASFEKTITKYV